MSYSYECDNCDYTVSVEDATDQVCPQCGGHLEVVENDD